MIKEVMRISGPKSRYIGNSFWVHHQSNKIKLSIMFTSSDMSALFFKVFLLQMINAMETS